MRRPIGTGSIVEVKPGTWRLQASLGYDVNGRRIRRTRTIRGTRADAERELRRMSLDSGGLAGKGMTVAEYLHEVWLPRKRPPVVRRRTWEGYRSKIATHVDPYIGHVRLQKLDALMIDDWISERRRHVLRSKTLEDGTTEPVYLSETSVNNAYRVLRTALRQALRWGLITVDPTRAVTPPRTSDFEAKVLDADSFNQVLDAAAGHWLEPVVVLALSAGLRRSEICGLLWSDIDFKARTVSITRGLHRSDGQMWTEPPKSKQSRRIVSLPDWAIESLRAHRGMGPVVPGAPGEPMDPDKVSDAYATFIAERGLPSVPLRCLRHTHATLELAEGTDVVTLSRRLGHSTVAITDEFYLKPGRAADRGAADAIEGVRVRQSLPRVPNDAKSERSQGHI